MKRITLVLLTTFFLGLFQSLPAQAEVCSNTTYTVNGINTFGDLPCKDPGTAINVTVRGLHNYGVSDGPTGWCSFVYIRRNLGTDEKPNWSASTSTSCDPKPTPEPTTEPTPEPTTEPTPEPTTEPTPEPTTEPTTEPTPEPTPTATLTPISSNTLAGFALVDQNNIVRDTIVRNVTEFSNGQTYTTDNGYCSTGCSVILQTQAKSDGSISHYETNDRTTVTYNDTEKTFDVTENGLVVSKVLAPEIIQTEESNLITSFEVLFFENELSNNGVFVNATNNTQTQNSTDVVTDNLILTQKVTEQQLETIINNGTTVVIKQNIRKLTRLLQSWLL